MTREILSISPLLSILVFVGLCLSHTFTRSLHYFSDSLSAGSMVATSRGSGELIFFHEAKRTSQTDSCLNDEKLSIRKFNRFKACHQIVFREYVPQEKSNLRVEWHCTHVSMCSQTQSTIGVTTHRKFHSFPCVGLGSTMLISSTSFSATQRQHCRSKLHDTPQKRPQR